MDWIRKKNILAQTQEALRKTKNKGVIISTETTNYTEKPKLSTQLTHSGLKLDNSMKRKPRLLSLA